MIGAMGRCIAARSGMPEGELATAISALKWHDPPKFDRYLSEVRAAAVNGYAVDDGNYLLGITSVAAPITSREGALTHCIAATTFKGRMERDTLRELGKALVTACNSTAPLLGSIR
jgi:DNA-binding IclR family transcriptional regulator